MVLGRKQYRQCTDQGNSFTSDKNVAQALTQLHILIIGCEVMRVMHDMGGLPELCAQGNPSGVHLLFLSGISVLMFCTQVSQLLL